MPHYLQQAIFLRDLAQLARSVEARQELLTLAIAYERLAERRQAVSAHPDSFPYSAGLA